MKKILFIATGGTIASKKTENGLTPQITPEELLSYIPEVEGLCEITAVNPFNLDSSNVVPENWSTLVKVVKEHYEDYDGFVIAHGTDTMAYTAAALSYMIQNSEKPIVITGAQRPINLDITDAKTNLSDSFYYACDDASQGVQIVFDGKVIAGTRAKKVRTKSYNAFSSINYPDIASIHDQKIIFYIDDKDQSTKPLVFYHEMNQKIFLLKLIPGIDGKVLDALFPSYSGLIIESFGVGGLPEYDGGHLYDVVRRGVERGKLVVMTTQVPNEGSDLTVYHVGGHLKSTLRLLEAYDMTTEAAVAKLMWIMGQTREFSEVERLFYQPVAQDILRFGDE